MRPFAPDSTVWICVLLIMSVGGPQLPGRCDERRSFTCSPKSIYMALQTNESISMPVSVPRAAAAKSLAFHKLLVALTVLVFVLLMSVLSVLRPIHLRALVDR